MANSVICATTSAFVNPFKSTEPERQEAVQAPHPLHRALLIWATCFSPTIVLFVRDLNGLIRTDALTEAASDTLPLIHLGDGPNRLKFSF